MRQEKTLYEILIRFEHGKYAGAHVIYNDVIFDDAGKIIHEKVGLPIDIYTSKTINDKESLLVNSIVDKIERFKTGELPPYTKHLTVFGRIKKLLSEGWNWINSLSISTMRPDIRDWLARRRKDTNRLN